MVSDCEVSIMIFLMLGITIDGKYAHSRLSNIADD